MLLSWSQQSSLRKEGSGRDSRVHEVRQQREGTAILEALAWLTAGWFLFHSDKQLKQSKSEVHLPHPPHPHLEGDAGAMQGLIVLPRRGKWVVRYVSFFVWSGRKSKVSVRVPDLSAWKAVKVIILTAIWVSSLVYTFIIPISDTDTVVDDED